MIGVEQNYFPKDMFQCYSEPGSHFPLVVAPLPQKKINLIDWAKDNQARISQAIKEFGAIVFTEFNLATKEDFGQAFTAITGNSPEPYKGDTPRQEIISNIYKSTAVANAHLVPLHQEVSVGSRKEMPTYIAFFCVTPPKPGTGQTLVGNVKEISKKIQSLMPHLWALMLTRTLTYTARYLPTNSWLTKWIRWLNPSFGTIQQRFGTENPREVEKICQQEGLTCQWDNGWAVVSRTGVPATINVNGKNLFCNQIHVDKLNPKLCGGWMNYILASILLCPTSRFMQFDVQFDGGTPIRSKDASQLLTILEQHQQGRDWRQGDLMILDNVTTMHGKTPHVGKREILVAMSGSVLGSQEI